MVVNGSDDLVLTGGRIHCRDGMLADGWLSVSGERISGVGTGNPPQGKHIDLNGAHVVPGFVDIHCHGGGGGSFTSADPAELFNPLGFPVYEAGRGGRYTYHGPGQRVGYLVLDLEKRGKDIRCFVHSLEGWMIDALAELGVAARREPGRIGIWTGKGPSEAKIGAIGVRVKRWVTLHGFSVNVEPDLAHFAGIVPCGISEYGVSSLAALGINAKMADLDAALTANFSGFLAELRACDKVP